MKSAIFILVFLFGVVFSVANSCTFPSNLQGTWESPTKGNITITSNQIVGYDIYTYAGLTFDCSINSNGRYILQSDNFTVLAGNEVYALLCLKLTQQTTNLYTYFVLTSELADANNERVVFQAATTLSYTEADACDDTSVQNTPQETKLLVRYGTASSEAIQCPNDILGQYWYYNGTSGGSSINCSASFWDVCTDLTTMTFDYTKCSTRLAYSAGGAVKCIYYVEDGTQSVMYLYNTDASVNGTVNSTYQYSCMVLEKNSVDSMVYVTMYPEECQANQSAYYVVSSGTQMTLSANIPSSSTSEAVSQAGLIAGVVVSVIIIIAVIGVVVGFFIWKKKKATRASFTRVTKSAYQRKTW